jgi:hypothetical protein
MRTSLLDSIVGALNNPRGEEARRVAAWMKTNPPTLLHNLPNPEFRLDSNGTPIRWSNYGDHNSPYGWHIEYIQPPTVVGDDLSNLRALHCRADSHEDGDARAASELRSDRIRCETCLGR